MRRIVTCCGRPVCVAGGVAGGALMAGVVVVLVEPTSAGCGAGGMALTAARGAGGAAGVGVAPAPSPAPPGNVPRFFTPPLPPPFDGASISFSSLSICAICGYQNICCG